jgi:hypothetical protein
MDAVARMLLLRSVRCIGSLLSKKLWLSDKPLKTNRHFGVTSYYDMSGSDGGRNVKKGTSKSQNKSRKSEDRTTKYDIPSVHKRNLYFVSFPVIFLFDILRSLLYQLFVIFKYLYTSTSKLVHRPQTNSTCKVEIVIPERECETEDYPQDMSHLHPKHPTGPGDPLLAKQKHHHRRAFEFISKALKIDEENEGKFILPVLEATPAIVFFSDFIAFIPNYFFLGVSLACQ